MKFLKVFSVLVLSAMTLNLSAALNAKAQLVFESADAITNYLISQDDAVANDFSSVNCGKIQANADSYAIFAYTLNDSKKYAAVELNDINGVEVIFEPNPFETSYTLTISNVEGGVKIMRGEEEVVSPYVMTGITAPVTFTVVMPQTPEEYIHHRAVAAGSFGTICFPNKITAMEGVKDGKLLEFVTNGVTFVEAQEVELANMEVGKAYIFEASADAQSFTYDPETSVASPIANNGLVGTFEEDGISIEADAWIIKGSAIKAVLAGSSVPQYRAYIPSLEDIQTIEPTPGAPIRRFLVGEATGLQEVKAMEGTRKAIVNGRLVIIREGRMFNALGGMK